jgi:hypothetical protein
MPLLKPALTEDLDGTSIWDRVADAKEELRARVRPRTTPVGTIQQQIVTIKRDGNWLTERLLIDKLITRPPRTTGRATACWKARGEDIAWGPLVIKDSWQYTDRPHEGELLKEATRKGVVNVARYFHHETVIPAMEADGTRSNDGESQDSMDTSDDHPIRELRRVILRDYGKPIYKASSRSALLAALAGCIKGHESLHKAGILHRDISPSNLMINEDPENLSWPSFLIDLDSATRERRHGTPGADEERNGRWVFMAIGVLMRERHSFMHDLESFFWVLF